jgi:mono/diheme cytochrome c family protein
MRRSWLMSGAVAVWMIVLLTSWTLHGRERAVAGTRAKAAHDQGTRQGGTVGTGGWTLPANAADEKSPLTVNAGVVAAGKKLFASKCQRCHGPEAKGDGPDADPARQGDMDLTVASRAARNPDGVVFFKLWNGRSSPKMPRFSEELSKEQAWAIVAYVQTLRAKQ